MWIFLLGSVRAFWSFNICSFNNSGFDLYLEAILLFESHFVIWRALLLHIVLLFNPASPCSFWFHCSFFSDSFLSYVILCSEKKPSGTFGQWFHEEHFYFIHTHTQQQCFQTFFQNKTRIPFPAASNHISLLSFKPSPILSKPFRLPLILPSRLFRF